jgi:hypothetical protein
MSRKNTLTLNSAPAAAPAAPVAEITSALEEGAAATPPAPDNSLHFEERPARVSQDTADAGQSETLPLHTLAALAVKETEQAPAAAEANQGATPEAPAAEPLAKAHAWKIGDVVELVSVHGPLQHLHTGDMFGAAPVTAEIDAFLSLQLDAGKLAIAPSES